MTFDEILAQATALLQRQGRVSYRALKLRFSLDDEHLAALQDELIDAQRLASDEEGKVLVWRGDAVPTPPVRQPEPAPLAYTPPHLRVLADHTSAPPTGDLHQALSLLERAVGLCEGAGTKS